MYADSETIYLIYAHYYPNAELQNKISPIANGNGSYTVRSIGGREALVDYLKDTNSWTNVSSAFNTKFDVTEITAKGAPTPDMWMASYNARYNKNLGAKNFKTTKQKYYNNTSRTTSTTTSDTGYLYTRNNEGDSTKWEMILPGDYMKTLAGYAKNMYYPETSRYDSYNCNGYWLAGPSAYASDCVCYVSYDSGVGHYLFYNDGLYAARPVVSIPRSKVNITVTGTGDSATLSLNKVTQ